MKLRNKISGEIKEFVLFDGDELQGGATLESLTKEWEDYKELKGYWYIRDDGSGVGFSPLDNSTVAQRRLVIGNRFESEEEAKRAVEKLKAWKRLKDKQFEFYRWGKGSLLRSKPNTIEFACNDYTKLWSWEDIQDDLDLLFGGGE